ncbi:hypothetical protein COCSUDRAFT_58644 [Coccomyxa subellipsoidea C-169]|uniref:Uncharacterized protein n=1 Tax=Coccomyxa subellipsoidea (strain C-169) TaxID=574566 RepID=I0YLT2_COCSC|nr:hypothetical protein COCSUDRAFT_58644 [Coccomyxa subellipsoidea C-169]EIE19351.1 hypothetical protein COCSUDRAFT_58644 [Coccomyxa subellipsoidea C-169]|eukprot:XP_005643895.1 hypothetical protein COCSUDRAFT_58644 [Coccomyxa subellipsoidea C-169]
MQRQRERSQTWSFFLGRHPDGAYYWHMWRDKHIPADAANTGVVKAEPGLDEAAQQRLVSAAKWSASVQVPLSALECRCESGPAAAETKVALRLLTDIQPGSEEELKALGDGAAEKASGKAWVFTGTSSLLKSALQKNVRLGRADAADALLHPSLPLLVWLMAAVPKGYALGRMLALACLTIIHEIASVPGQQEAQAHYQDCSWRLLLAIWFECVETLSLLKGAPVTQRTAQPDAPWMAYLHQQFSAAAGGDLQQLGCMEPGDIPLSAVDFHVSNIIEEVLNNREVLTAALAVGRDPLQAMRDTIWIFSSSTNSRAWLQAPEQERQERLRTRRSELEGIWKLAAPAAKNFARKYIKARFREL